MFEYRDWMYDGKSLTEKSLNKKMIKEYLKDTFCPYDFEDVVNIIRVCDVEYIKLKQELKDKQREQKNG